MSAEFSCEKAFVCPRRLGIVGASRYLDPIFGAANNSATKPYDSAEAPAGVAAGDGREP